MTIYNFGLLNIPFANGAPSGEIAPFPDYDRGLGIAFEQTDGKPEMKGLNGLFNIITSSLLYLRQRGIGEWSSDYEYPVGSFVTSGASLYKAKTVNTNKNPATSQTDWQLWASVSDITVSTNGNLKKTNNANGSIHLEVPTADTTQRGAMRFANATEVVNKSTTQAAVTAANAATVAQSTDLGVGQTWQNVTSSRSIGNTYTNNTGKPIQVLIVANGSTSTTGNSIIVGGVTIAEFYTHNSMTAPFSFVVPSGQTYKLNLKTSINSWSELR